MSNFLPAVVPSPIVPVVPDEVIDPIALNARLLALRAEYERTKREGPCIPLNASDPERDEIHKQHKLREVSMIKEQIDIISKLRRTASTSGPAKAGGKRAKKAPVDLSHLLSD